MTRAALQAIARQVRALWPLSVSVSIEFDSAQDDWWMPNGRGWRLVACGISVLYGARVGALGLHLAASIEFYCPDCVEPDDQRDSLRAAGIDPDDLFEVDPRE